MTGEHEQTRPRVRPRALGAAGEDNSVPGACETDAGADDSVDCRLPASSKNAKMRGTPLVVMLASAAEGGRAMKEK